MNPLIRIIEPGGRDKPALPIGTLVLVRAKGYDVVCRNDMGGTMAAPEGLYKVRIVREWWDYETGQHYAGMLRYQKDLKRIAKAAKTPYAPKAKDVDPTMVFFGDDAIVEPEDSDCSPAGPM